MSNPVLLMTRPRAASERFVARLDVAVVANTRVIFAPLIRIDPLDAQVSIASDDGAIFTSAHGVEFAPEGAGRRAYCVGARTAEMATGRGWRVMLTAQNADDLVTRIAEVSHPLVHLAGRHRRGEIVERLCDMGLRARVLELYDQVLLPFEPDVLPHVSGEAAPIVPLFSPRTAAQFANEAHALPKAQVLALSTAVANALGGAFAGKVHIAHAPTSEDMRLGVEILLRGHSLP